jgi:oligopeptide transport system substrate-binding protein
MKGTAARALACVVGLALFLAGCSGGAGSGGGLKTPLAPKALPVQELRLNLGAEPPSMDTTGTDEVSFQILANTLEGLVRMGEGSQVIPGVAAHWEVKNGVEYTFTLRDGAQWSDGHPVTSRDFQYAWLRILDPKTAADYAYLLYYIKGAEEYNTLSPDSPNYEARARDMRDAVGIAAPDDHTLKVTLKQPSLQWLKLTAFPTYYPVREDMVAKSGEQYANEPRSMVFDGPFVLDTWAHGDQIVLRKNEKYWDARAVRLDRVIFQMIKDPEVVIRMYDAGELDRADLPGEYIPAYQAEQGFSTVVDVTTWYVTLNLRRKELQSLNLRKALSLAFDRRQFIETVLRDGSIPAAGLVPPSIPGENGKSFRQISGVHFPPAADPGAARQLWTAGLQELGMSSLHLRLLMMDSPRSKKLVQGLQEMLQSELPGLVLELEPEDLRAMVDRTREGDFDLAYAGWGADYDDPMTFLDMWLSTSPFNDARWSDQVYDVLIRKAQSTTDQSERVMALAEAERILAAQVPVIPLYHPAWGRVTRPWAKGIRDFPWGARLDLKGAYIEGRK